MQGIPLNGFAGLNGADPFATAAPKTQEAVDEEIVKASPTTHDLLTLRRAFSAGADFTASREGDLEPDGAPDTASSTESGTASTSDAASSASDGQSGSAATADSSDTVSVTNADTANTTTPDDAFAEAAPGGG